MIFEILQSWKVIPSCCDHPEPGLNLKISKIEKWRQLSKSFIIFLCSLSKHSFDIWQKVKISRLPNNKHLEPEFHLLPFSLLFLWRGLKHFTLHDGEGNIAQPSSIPIKGIIYWDYFSSIPVSKSQESKALCWALQWVRESKQVQGFPPNIS